MANDAPAEAPHAIPRHIHAVLDTLNTSGPDTQGRLALARALLGSADERALAKLKVHDGTTLLDRYRQLQNVAMVIDANEKLRAAASAETITGASTVKARNQWIRVINALAAVLAATGTDEAPILGRVRALEAKAEGRATPATDDGDKPVTPATE